MENIKSDYGILELKDGKIDIILSTPDRKFYPKRQSEIKDMELSFDGIFCTITGMKTEFKFYDDFSLEKFTEKEIEDADFKKNEIEYREKKIWHLFKKNEIKKVPYLDGHIRLKEKTPIKITTSLWILYDQRKPITETPIKEK